MITEARVLNYKGIKECKVKDLSRVNLFIGKNDSGKSTILEAIFHTCKEFVTTSLSDVMRRRTNVFTGGRELWYRYDTRPKINVSLSFEEIDIGLTLEMEQAQRLINTMLDVSVLVKPKKRWSQERKGSAYRSTNFTTHANRPSAGIDLLNTSRNVLTTSKVEKLTRYFRNAVFIDCRSKSTLSNLESRLTQIKLDGKDEEFGGILENIYGKGKEWEFLPHPDSPSEKRVAVKEGGKRTFLSDFGDGFRYALAMCATAMTVEGTGIFIEELENHQHSGALEQLIPNLVEISGKNDLQLFISTHNFDTWNTFFYGAYRGKVERRKKEFRNFIVERDIASGKVTAEPTENVQRISEELGRR